MQDCTPNFYMMKFTNNLFLVVLLTLIVLNNVFGDDSSAGFYYTAFDSASWAITSDELSPVLGDDKQTLYNEYIDGCNMAMFEGNETKIQDALQTNSTEECSFQDKYRQKMNREQPTSVYNYTNKGYDKIKAPAELMDIIREFWTNNRHKAEIEWKDTNVYHNNWDSPPTIVHLGQTRSGGSMELQQKVWDLVKPILEEWTGQHLSPVSLYGIRLYHNNSILAPHVDRMPLIASAIIQVDQDVDEPWPLEVYGHDGKATNVTMEPGDMVLYESHSVIHGRPFPMRGNFYANFFAHFEPLGPLNGKSDFDPELGIPPYIIPGSAWESEWKRNNPRGWDKLQSDSAAILARNGDLKGLKALAAYNARSLKEPDDLGWTPLHEGVRSGNIDLVQYLLDLGADKDLLTRSGTSPLWISRHYLGRKHPMSQYLEEIGAVSTFPDPRQITVSQDEL